MTAMPASQPAPLPLRVIVADDHRLFRYAVCAAVRRDPALRLVGEAADGDEALELIDALQPDVAVLDHRMPALTGTEVCARLQAREARPPTALLLLSAFDDAELVVGAVRAGAAGYLAKSGSPAEICAAIEQVGQGGVAFSEATARAVSGSRARRRPAGSSTGAAQPIGGRPTAARMGSASPPS